MVISNMHWLVQEKEEDWDPELELGSSIGDGERQWLFKLCTAFPLLILTPIIIAPGFLAYEKVTKKPYLMNFMRYMCV